MWWLFVDWNYAGLKLCQPCFWHLAPLPTSLSCQLRLLPEVSICLALLVTCSLTSLECNGVFLTAVFQQEQTSGFLADPSQNAWIGPSVYPVNWFGISILSLSFQGVDHYIIHQYISCDVLLLFETHGDFFRTSWQKYLDVPIAISHTISSIQMFCLIQVTRKRMMSHLRSWVTFESYFFLDKLQKQMNKCLK